MVLRITALACLVFVGHLSAQIGLPPARAALVRTLLNGVDWRQRAEAARLLGLSGDPRVIEPLATAASHDTMPEVRRAARHSIRQLRGDLARPPGPIGPVVPVDPNAALVNAWFMRFLGRSADPGGLRSNVDMLRRGVPRDEVLSLILGSDEYWNRQGGTPEGFVAGLYRDLMGHPPGRMEGAIWARRYFVLRENRSALAREIIATAQREALDRSRRSPLDSW